jgi:hypothetical protein
MAKKTRISKKSKKLRVTRNRRLVKSRFSGGGDEDQNKINKINEKINDILKFQRIRYLTESSDDKKADLIRFNIRNIDYLGRMIPTRIEIDETIGIKRCYIIELYSKLNEKREMVVFDKKYEIAMFNSPDTNKFNIYEWNEINANDKSYITRDERNFNPPPPDKTLIDYYTIRGSHNLFRSHSITGRKPAKTYCTNQNNIVRHSSASGICLEADESGKWMKNIRCFGDNLYNDGTNLTELLNANDAAKNYCRVKV